MKTLGTCHLPKPLSKCLLLQSILIRDARLSTPGRAVSEPNFLQGVPPALHPERHAPKTTKPGALQFLASFELLCLIPWQGTDPNTLECSFQLSPPSLMGVDKTVNIHKLF